MIIYYAIIFCQYNVFILTALPSLLFFQTSQALAAGFAAFFLVAFAIGYSMDPPY